MQPSTLRYSVLTMLFSLIITISANAQTQLDIIGPNFTNETVVKIVAGSAELQQNAIALEVEALQTTFATGIAGRFSADGTGVWGTSTSRDGVFGDGFLRGVRGISELGTGVQGESTDGFGIRGTSTDGTGAFIEGGGGIAIELGGADSEYGAGSDDAVIRTQADQTGGDLILVSNDAIELHLDDDSNSSSNFRIKNSGNDNALSLSESGNLTISGTLSQASDINRKKNIINVDPKIILSKVSDLPITKWSYKREDIRHIGPMSQDFYAAFGLGQGDTTISSIDADGIALASIKALIEQNQELKANLADQNNLIRQLSSRISKLEKR